MQRNLKYYVATSLDGFIAHEDGSWGGFVPEGDHVTDYLGSLQEFDTVLMGRKTYEVGLNMGQTNPYPLMKSYVFSRTIPESPDPQVTLVSEAVGEFVRALKQDPGQDIYLCGGGALATTLFAEQLIDQVIVKLNPVLFGAGIPLLSSIGQPIELALTDRKIYDNGVVFLYYQVKY